MAKTIELKACPLCGAPGKGKRSETSFPHGWVGCPDCGLYINWVHEPKDAVRKWNRRVSDGDTQSKAVPVLRGDAEV